jgi:hypothetical protein
MVGTHAAVYSATVGKMVGQMYDSPVLLLVTTRSSERKTGRARLPRCADRGGAERLEMARV